MNWEEIFEAIVAILIAGLIAYVFQLFLPDNHRRKFQKVLKEIVRYLL